MTAGQAVLLGVVQGVTEFLPISSSGHLVLLQTLLRIPAASLAFDTALHAGTLAAVIAAFWSDLAQIAQRKLDPLLYRIAASTAPTVAVGWLFQDIFEQLFHSGATLGIEFVLTGTLLLWIESVHVKKVDRRPETLPYRSAFWIGIAQGAAILPALSRSGLTLAAGMGAGLDRTDAVRYSFLISIPVIFGATLVEAIKLESASGAVPVPWAVLTVGVAASAATGYVSIRWLLRFVKKATLRPFGYYAIAVGTAVLADQLVFHRFF